MGEIIFNFTLKGKFWNLTWEKSKNNDKEGEGLSI
jgi:hypothetical protein